MASRISSPRLAAVICAIESPYLAILNFSTFSLLAEQKPGARHAVAQRDAPHLEGTVFQQQGVLGRVDLGPRDGVGQLRVEVPEVAGQDLAEGRRGEDPERGFASVQRQRRDEREQPENMVSVEVRDEYGPDFQRIDAVADQLLLHAFARIHEVILFVDVDRLRRRVAGDGRLCGGRAQYGDRETQFVCVLYFMNVARSRLVVKTLWDVVAVRVLLPSSFFSIFSVVV